MVIVMMLMIMMIVSSSSSSRHVSENLTIQRAALPSPSYKVHLSQYPIFGLDSRRTTRRARRYRPNISVFAKYRPFPFVCCGSAGDHEKLGNVGYRYCKLRQRWVTGEPQNILSYTVNLIVWEVQTWRFFTDGSVCPIRWL